MGISDRPLKLKSIQRGLITIPSMSYSADVAISEVNLSKAALHQLGSYATLNDYKMAITLKMLNSTTVRASKYSLVDSASANFEVIEYQ